MFSLESHNKKYKAMESNNELPFLDFETVDVADDASCGSDLSDFDVMAAAKQQLKRRSSILHRNPVPIGDGGIETHGSVPQDPVQNENSSVNTAPSAMETKSVSRSFQKTAASTISDRFLKTTASAFERQRQHATKHQHPPSKPAKIEQKLTIPQSPKLRCLSRSRERIESSEEREMRLIAEAKKAEDERKRKNQRSMMFNKAKSTLPVHNVVRSTKPLTIPNTPCNHLSKRRGEKVYSTTGTAKPVETSRPTSAPSTGPRPLTQPEPFKLRIDERSGIHLPAENVLTAGEMCSKFESDPRSHYVPDRQPALTEAHSPKLQTKIRATSSGRPLPKSREQLENDLLEDAQRHSFKAKPVDKRIFNSLGELGVPKIQPKPATTFEEFHFHYTEERALQRQHKDEKEDYMANVEFKALPMPDFNSLPSTQAVVHPAPCPLTLPMSPKFSAGRRASSAPARRQLPHHDDVVRNQKIKQVEEKVWLSRPMVLTEPEGFQLSTEQRGQMFREVLKQRLKMEEEEERKQREFKAQDIKISEHVFVPEPSRKELTDFKEFHLLTEDRHALAHAKKLKEDAVREQQEIEMSRFHARPVPKAVVDPNAAFSVRKEPKATTCPQEIHLSTDERARKRKQFQKQFEKRKREQDEMKRKLEEQKEREELENLATLRRKPIEEGGMCFKAQPIKLHPKSLAASADETDVAGLTTTQTVFLERSLNAFAIEEISTAGEL